MPGRRWAVALRVALVAAAIGSAPAPAAQFLQLVDVIASGLSNPVGAVNAGDGTGRLFIVQQGGQIRLWDAGQLRTTPFLDISGLVSPGGGERGLLGLAFHPDYEINGFFYVYYTRASDGDIVIARYRVSGNPGVADPSSALVLIAVEHSSASNHNGGQLAFGPDGYLYAGVGDGGGGGDPDENGQNTATLLGKVLRLDVDTDGFPADPTRNYGIPPTNPFAGAVAGADEVWDFGLRNPWRLSFDRQTGDLYIGDVGQSAWEEMNFEAAGSAGGRNYGWDCREGAHVYTGVDNDGNAGCSGPTFVDPVLEYDHSLGCSITGGFAYRGRPASPQSGSVIYGDYCSGRIWSGANGGSGWVATQLSGSTAVPSTFGLTSFGESETGRLYLTYDNGVMRWLAPYTFQDVTPGYWAWPFVEAIAEAGVTAGCDTVPRYCPSSLLSRAEMAVMMVRGVHGASFVPPPATGTVFSDVSAAYWAAPWIEQLFRDGFTAGCAASPRRYCPDANVSRAEMAVFMDKLLHGASFTPSPASGTVFADVPADHWAAGWIEQLYADGGTAGCATSPLRYCPSGQVARDQAAVFLARSLALPLP